MFGLNNCRNGVQLCCQNSLDSETADQKGDAKFYCDSFPSLYLSAVVKKISIKIG